MTRNRKRSLIAVGTVLALVFVVFYGVNLVRAGDALDFCASEHPAAVESDYTGASVEYSPLPWRWTCVYSDDQDREFRRGASVTPWPF